MEKQFARSVLLRRCIELIRTCKKLAAEEDDFDKKLLWRSKAHDYVTCFCQMVWLSPDYYKLFSTIVINYFEDAIF